MPLLPRRRAPGADLPAAAEMEPPQLRTPRSAAWWIVPITLMVGGVVGGLVWLPLGTGWSAAEIAIRQDVIRTALAAGAGVGAAVTLMLAFRRQRHQEHAAHVTAHLTARNAAVAELVAKNSEHDATERRVTDLYTKAVEQLGHGKAAVRLGGLYALERVAQDNPDHRQTIVNVICAYLRMPYTVPTPTTPAQERAAALRAARIRHHAARAGKTPPVASPTTPADAADRDGERQVRLTAQRILADHLRDDRLADQRTTTPAAQSFWDGMRIDLSGATLIDLDFTGCRIAGATFTNATFSGDAGFGGVTFSQYAVFDGVTFSQYAGFGGAIFSGHAGFGGATFSQYAVFDGATFSQYAWFNGATFSGDAGFRQATFSQYAGFDGAIFSGDAGFDRATFFRSPGFRGATASCEGDHVWPDGWRLQATSATEGRLVEDGAADDSVDGPREDT
uniref:pentapeptide repeat-containing protein n=1 Tax=Streptosporangium sp. CA-235898 TaxID=3240073 RepID=UPI003F4975A4